MTDLTPVETVFSKAFVQVKRDDLYSFAGVRGGKVRTCRALAQTAVDQGFKGLVTAGARSSPQAVIVAAIARYYGLVCHIHMPTGELSTQGKIAQEMGAKIIQHYPGHNSVIIARAREDGVTNHLFEIPFGVECDEAVNQTAAQCENLPYGSFARIVVPVGSGMSLAGIIQGVRKFDKNGMGIPIVGVIVGADPVKRLNRYAPSMWRYQTTLVHSEYKYSDQVIKSITTTGPVLLDPIYEAKAYQFVKHDDLFWIVGVREYDNNN